MNVESSYSSNLLNVFQDQMPIYIGITPISDSYNNKTIWFNIFNFKKCKKKLVSCKWKLANGSSMEHNLATTFVMENAWNAILYIRANLLGYSWNESFLIRRTLQFITAFKVLIKKR